VRARISKRLDGKESLAVHVLQCLSGIIGCLSRQLFVALQMASLCTFFSIGTLFGFPIESNRNVGGDKLIMMYFFDKSGFLVILMPHVILRWNCFVILHYVQRNEDEAEVVQINAT
jgi:hypothetical protein